MLINMYIPLRFPSPGLVDGQTGYAEYGLSGLDALLVVTAWDTMVEVMRTSNNTLRLNVN